MKKLLLTLICCLSLIQVWADAPLRRPISNTQPAWFVHIDNWNDADPQKIIDMIPADIRPYVVFNISMSISHDETTGEFNRVPNGYSTARSWLRVCAENNVWAMVQCASGGYAHFSETDLRIYEEFYREYPNFIGWNYAEQFWGFDNQFSCTFNERLSHFADLMKLARKYGGYTCISFCGNVWSLALNPLAMMKRNEAFAEQCRQAPQNLIICDKYTMSSMFYEYESTNFGTYVAGFTTNYGIRFDQCGWGAALESEKDNMPAAAGVAPVLNNWLLTGGTVNDGPELIWQQCFQTGGTNNLSDGYKHRVFKRFPQFDNVSIDLYRKILDGTVRIPSREEVIDRHKLVIINDLNTGDDGTIYGAPNNLYDGLYSTVPGAYYHDQTDWFKKTGRYPTIPIVSELVDGLANSVQTQVKRSQIASRWSTQTKKVNEFNELFPQEYTGGAFAGRVDNRWLIYNPYKTGASARALIPFKYNTCESIRFNLAQYSNVLMKEEATAIHLYMNNYRTDVTALKNDTIIINGSTAQPQLKWKDRASHTASKLVSETWADGVYTAIIAHNGALDVDITCAGTATGRLTPKADNVLVKPEAPAKYYGPITHECEDFDAKYTNSYKLAPWALNDDTRGFHGLGYHDFGTNTQASIRDTFLIPKEGKHYVKIRYKAPNGRGLLNLYVQGTRTVLRLPQTTGNAWGEFTVSGVTFAEGKNELLLTSCTNMNTLYLDQVTVGDPDYRYPTAFNVDRYVMESFATSQGDADIDSVFINARSITGPVSVVTNGNFTVSTQKNGDYSNELAVTPDENGNLFNSIVYIRFAGDEVGDYTGSATFTANGCLDHVLPLEGTVNPPTVTLMYDFTDDKATTIATTPPAKGVALSAVGKVTAGVASYKGSNALKVYSTSGRNGSGALDLTRFTSKATDYSVTWKHYTTTTDDYKCGVLLRGGKIVGTSSAGYAEGFREGYACIIYTNSTGSAFRIYKSTANTSLNMICNQGSSFMPAVGTPTWYRASVSGTGAVTIKIEYSTDGENWTLAAQTTDVDSKFDSGSTQLVWGLAAKRENFYYDDIIFNGVTFDPTGIGGATAAQPAGDNGSPMYNLSGQRVGKEYKGVKVTRGKVWIDR